MDIVRLRTMTEKSIIGFGKYTDLSVGNLLSMNKTRELRWIYFNCSFLTFMPEILEKIGITEHFKIEKPGTNKELCLEINKLADMRISGIRKYRLSSKKKSENKAKIVQMIKRDNIYYSKANLAWKNQGH